MLSRRPSGFTIVELMVGVALIAVILAMGAPMLGTYLQNAKLGTATQDWYTGLQDARTEAIHRNAPVDFVMTDTAVNTANLANVVAPSATGHSWAVRASDPSPGGTYSLVEVKGGGEGADDPNSISSAQITATGPAGFDGIVTFNGFGGTADGNPYTFDIRNSAAGTCKADGGTIRCRRIVVTSGGRITACDPAASAGADTRAC